MQDVGKTNELQLNALLLFTHVLAGQDKTNKKNE